MTIQFLIVPGAWHPAQAYSPLANALQKHGFKATIASYPSLNAPIPMNASCAQDGAAVRALLLSLLEEDSKEEPKIVVVNHSYGGMVGCAAAYGEHLKGRKAAGKNGGVIGIINMAGFPGKEGASMMQGTGGSAEYVRNNQPAPGLCEVENPAEVFFHDVDADLANDTIKLLRPHSMNAFETPPGPSATTEPELKGRLAFLKTTQDKALPPAAQDMFMELVESMDGVKWLRKEIEASHSPFLSKPEETARILEEWGVYFEGLGW
ncbi:alpha/beta-hydrolase [Gymnopus androsaceus JB14]|uniref:Alpha/beta-hydrolase n=1 Tax=Gymnopus androsaceus JB14 TaxID=1447944 RepID=A0A6A4H7S2_9AGAR|nr:alpha/beta-hydrolase [Gymnopus androsaceus JB14]